jgi:exosortase/archaeosortase family protein
MHSTASDVCRSFNQQENDHIPKSTSLTSRPMDSSVAAITHPRFGIAALVVSIWIPVFVMNSQAWRYGDFYDYGWYVPPLALLIFIKRWRMMPGERMGGPVRWITCIPWIAPLWLACRILNEADPYWRLPQWIAAAIALFISHLLIVHSCGRRASRSFSMLAAFVLTAVPLPTFIETSVVHYLSESVIHVTAEIFRILGRPVQVWGQRMESLGEWVEVADGCSGIRSLQGFLMVALFFGEWFQLGRLERFLMILLSLISVWLANVMRAMTLAWLRFEHGEGMFDRWHDSLSLLTFGVAAAMAWWLASRLESDKTQTPAQHARVPSGAGFSAPPKREVWIGMGLLAGMELAAWVWMNPPHPVNPAVLEIRYPPPGMEPRFNIAEYQKAQPSLRCNDGWMAAIGEDLGARKMRAGWFAWDSTDGSSVLDVYHHSPEKCMGAIGWELVAAGQTRTLDAPGLCLTFGVTEFKDPAFDTTIYVYKTVWFSTPRRPVGIDDMSAADALRRLRLTMAWHRFRPHHARVLMGVVAGEEQEADAWKRFHSSLLGGLHLQAPPEPAINL